ncbi:unnamed protein product [Lepeophtheirus salmonis]|uniref:(salmon louse) hypothetical protein n=1 Tax=Lepeophtheirus salmonis TaxID=72036 RepID=A0A7R8CXQ3_LEPSM|nr:unnamed protein product [Lepeophtheirus salmonis]CAF2917101.1 unnamed protein product [Lepeophtheirus salmonis]
MDSPRRLRNNSRQDVLHIPHFIEKVPVLWIIRRIGQHHGLSEYKGNFSVKDLAKIIIEAILPFWQMARIKKMVFNNSIQRFTKLHDKYALLRKYKGRAGESNRKKDEFMLELDSLFDNVAGYAIKEIMSNRLLSKEKMEEYI